MRLWWVCEKLVDLVVWLLDYWLLRSSVQYIKHHLHSQHYYIYFIVIFSIITYQILFSQGQHYYISNTLLYRISWTLLCGETIKWQNLYSCRQLVFNPLDRCWYCINRDSFILLLQKFDFDEFVKSLSFLRASTLAYIYIIKGIIYIFKNWHKRWRCNRGPYADEWQWRSGHYSFTIPFSLFEPNGVILASGGCLKDAQCPEGVWKMTGGCL